MDQSTRNHGVCPKDSRILKANGFEPYAVICKVAGKAKSSIGIPKQCEEIGAAMCNPILQARLLNNAKTDLNVVIGLCVGHDSLFYRYSDAYVTTLITKDRVTGNNPAAVLYTAQSYYKKKMKLQKLHIKHKPNHFQMGTKKIAEQTPLFYYA